MTEAQTQTKRPRVVSFNVADDGKLTIDFAADGVEALSMEPGNLPVDIQMRAVVEGIITRLRRYGEDGETAEDKRAAIEKGIAQLVAGQWGAPRGAGGGAEFSLTILAAHEYKLAKARKLGQEYIGSVQDTADELAPILDEYDTAQEAAKGLDDKARAAALAGTRLAKLKATAMFQAAWTKVKAEKAAKDAEKAAKKAETAEDSGGF